MTQRDKDKNIKLNFDHVKPSHLTNRAIQAQHDDHEEEDDGEEGGSRHVCYGFCINDKEQTGAWREKKRQAG